MGFDPRFLVAACGVLAVVSHQGSASAAEPTVAKIVDVQKIWDAAPHNAFTDLIHHAGRWYCVFREGSTHVSPDGILRVLISDDGIAWNSAAEIRMPKADLRDAKISVAADGRLMLCGAGALHQPAAATHQSYVWYSSDGREWGEAVAIGEPNYWIWRISWHRGKAYGVGYGTGEDRGTRLYASDDGRNFEVLVPELVEGNFPNEASLLFRGDDSGLCLLRRDGESETSALLGSAKPPYRDWLWRDLGLRIGGPELLELPDGRIIAAGRKHDEGAGTRLWLLNPVTAELRELLDLPSGGDTSYPGLVYHEGRLWVSYYSSHEGKANIYLARVELPPAS